MLMEQERSGKRNMSIDYRSLGELIRGLFFMLFGLFAIFAERLHMGEFRVSQTVLNIFGGVLIAYGIFRVYRGVKNSFFNRN
ncbi:hypothetical protein [Chitinophaga silvisoli]|uniref:Uncharacterized protein n=1 Tax=Chitinophaga silvisoli TaxID=2291814 RepID=A0A3E1P2I6_9BACT|nr:hypothetical protein [Chitinophaga silvisoli]RFM34340.1 hypothetical protein DXN04_13740 [Chitinophaga silvisoli]